MAKPRFTIIVPSYNGGEYLKQCVHSVLAQTYADFELAVLEDGSDDGSLQWLQSLSEPRLKIYPASHLGIVGNWGRALEIPRGEYMTILGQDDLLDANYLQVMDELITEYPDAGLYHAHFRFIDAGGKVWRSCRPMPEKETAAGYITALYSGQRDTYGSGYLFSSARYDAVGGIPPYEKLLFADDVLWITLMRGTYKAAAPEECFACRVHPASVGASSSWRPWLRSMEKYIAFLTGVAAEDLVFREALTTHAPSYFLWWCRMLYARALVEDSKRNKRLERSDFEAIVAVLAQIAPHLVEELRDEKQFRLRKFINSNPLTRMAYIAYILARHGRSELPAKSE